MVLETTGSVWDIYDMVAPLVSKTVVANAHQVRQIAEARVKTDKEDIRRLITLLIADIVPEVWVPPQHVRELRALISFRWRLTKQLTMSKNRLHSVVQRFNLQPPKGGLLADKNRSWWEAQEFSELTAFQVERDLEIVAQLEAQKAALDQKLAELSNTEPWAADMVFLLQIPGFGIIFSMVVLAAIGDIRPLCALQEIGRLCRAGRRGARQRGEIPGEVHHQSGSQRAALGPGGGRLGGGPQRSLLESPVPAVGETHAPQPSHCRHCQKIAGFPLAHPHQAGTLSPFQRRNHCLQNADLGLEPG